LSFATPQVGLDRSAIDGSEKLCGANSLAFPNQNLTDDSTNRNAKGHHAIYCFD
jgi:hypothetical protein